jgi:hypothetical protein
MEFRFSDKGVFKRIGQAVYQGLLQLGLEFIGRFDIGLICRRRNLLPICTERGYMNFVCVSPIFDIYFGAIFKTKFIPFYFMPSHLQLLFYDGYDGLVVLVPCVLWRLCTGAGPHGKAPAASIACIAWLCPVS